MSEEPTVNISVELDSKDNNWLDILIVEKRGEGQVFCEHYRLERTKRAKPGKIGVRRAVRNSEREQTLEERIREKVRERYEVADGDGVDDGGGGGDLP